MIRDTTLPASVLADLAGILPGPEPWIEAGAPAARPGGPVVIPVSAPRLDGNELRYLTECVQSSWISSGGRFVGAFEEMFAAAVGCRYGVACSSGTTALHLLLATLGIGPGDEVIIPAFTMIATANAVRYTGAAPVLVDAERETWNLDPDRVEEKITRRTRGICVVHTYGHPASMDRLLALAGRHGLWVIEDAAEAHGARYGAQAVGSLGRAATFSFYANKIITTGEGGMVTTNDPELAAVARRLREHAFSPERHFWHTLVGFNYRMTNLQAAIGLAQTERLSSLVEVRRANAARYAAGLAGVPGLTLPVERPGVRNVFWMYGLLVEDGFGISRDELRRHLAEHGIETRAFFIPIHLQPVYHAAFQGQRYPVAEDLCRRGLYLPSGATLTAAEVAEVCARVREARKSG